MSSFDDFFHAIMGQESGGNYRAVNGRTGAMGAYQILPSNIGPWSRQYLGYQITPTQFLNSSSLQDKLARAVLQAQFDRYGAAGAASWWYSGSANNVDSTRSSHGEPSVSQYVQQVLARMTGDYGVQPGSHSIGKTVDKRVQNSALADLMPKQSSGPTVDALAGADRGGLGLAAADKPQGIEAVGLGLGAAAPDVTAPAGQQDGPDKVTVDDAAQAATRIPTGTLGEGKWGAPVSSGAFTSGYGMRNGRMHTGSDFAVPTGTPLSAMSNGVVTFVGNRGGKGNTVVIRYWDGTESTYAHMSSFGVKVGQQVGAGTVVGLSGNTGNSTGPHLHLEIRNPQGDLVDPRSWLKSMGINW